MKLLKWDELPKKMQTDGVRPYYEILRKKRISLLLKRIFDLILSSILIVLFSPIYLILGIAIKMDSKGPVFFRQTRVTQYGREFRIFKFRSMVSDAEKLGTQVTTIDDNRITKMGHIIRKCRLDEIAQLLNVINGDMTFVGTRPEVPKYVTCYTNEMLATLLLPAGITSKASIEYKDEDELLVKPGDTDEIYTKEVLPGKMKINLDELKNFSLIGDIKVLIDTAIAVIK